MISISYLVVFCFHAFIQAYFCNDFKDLKTKTIMNNEAPEYVVPFSIVLQLMHMCTIPVDICHIFFVQFWTFYNFWVDVLVAPKIACKSYLFSSAFHTTYIDLYLYGQIFYQG